MSGVVGWPCSLAVTVVTEANQKVKHDGISSVSLLKEDDQVVQARIQNI